MPHLTPDFESGTLYRSLNIPTWLLPHVNGALLWLTEVWHWEAFGDMTPQQCADGALEMWNAYLESNTMIGTVLPYATTTPPDNCLPCDGGTYNRVDYPTLYSRLDNAFIVDGDTFVTPDMDNRFPLGAESDIGQTGGAATHTLISDEMPSHYHAIQNGYGPSVALSAVMGAIEGLDAIPTAENTSSVGGGEAHNNMPPYIRLRYCIVAR